jgi:hypothetical protein
MKFTPVHLHLELKDDYLTEDQKKKLTKILGIFIGSGYMQGFLFTSDLPLLNLHYAIAKTFWLAKFTLGCFRLTEDVYKTDRGP